MIDPEAAVTVLYELTLASPLFYFVFNQYKDSQKQPITG